MQLLCQGVEQIGGGNHNINRGFEMRRKKQQIEDRERINSILRRTQIGRLATIGTDGYPYITPVNFVYWEDSIYFHCARAGEKLDNIAAENKVCFEVDIPLSYLDSGYENLKDPCEVGQFYQSVIIRGRAEIVEDPEEKLGALNALMGCHEGDQNYCGIQPAMKGFDGCLVVAIRIESISGKENLAQTKSAEEKENIRQYLSERNRGPDAETVKMI